MTQQHKHKFAALILAAGKGTRMKSDLPKVMHKLAGKPLIAHVLASVAPLKPEKTVVVIAPGMDSVKAACSGAEFAIQKEQRGTGHAVSSALPQLKGYAGKVLVLYGDTPMISTATLQSLLKSDADIAVLGMQLENPTGYGRLVTSGHRLLSIVECKDASPEQKRILLVNSGVMAISGKYLPELLKSLQPNNAAKEYYLTDIIASANAKGLRCDVVIAENSAELSGINSRTQLAEAEATVQNLLRNRAMEQGVTLVDPTSVYLSMDTKFGRDITIYPQVVFGTGVTVADGVEIRSFSHIEGASIGKNAIIGPFARLRPGSVIGESAHVGNFVELKATKLGKGAKANHLSYVGDSEVGENANIGAGTITCNYDGVNKYKTKIGAGAFIGSNSALVAPVTIGKNALVAAGSVITDNVPDNALGIARGRQVNKKSKPKPKSAKR